MTRLRGAVPAGVAPRLILVNVPIVTLLFKRSASPLIKLGFAVIAGVFFLWDCRFDL